MSVEKFARFLAQRAPDVVSFTAAEIFTRGGQDHDLKLNTDPPEELWPNILPALRALQALRTRLGAPIIIHSAYRSPAYNRAIGGATHSEHMRFAAIDFHVATPNSGPADWKATLSAMRAQGVFSGGLGAYETFVHIDGRGSNVDFDKIDARNGRVLPPVRSSIPVSDAVPPPPPRPTTPSVTVGQGASGVVVAGGASAAGAGLESGNGWLIAGGLIVLALGIVGFFVARRK